MVTGPPSRATLTAFPIPSGLHVLSWDANTFYDTGSSPTDAGWLDDVVFAPAYAVPVMISSLALVGTNFQFSFVSQANHTNFVQYSTNLSNPAWLPYSTIIGDGSTKTITVRPAARRKNTSAFKPNNRTRLSHNEA